jgi:hypothetical protein
MEVRVLISATPYVQTRTGWKDVSVTYTQILELPDGGHELTSLEVSINGTPSIRTVTSKTWSTTEQRWWLQLGQVSDKTLEKLKKDSSWTYISLT